MKKIDYKLLVISVGISAGLVLFVLGVRSGLSGRDATNLPEAIEQISPGQGERVLRQSQVIIDFIEGYTATLTIDGIELPTTRLDELSLPENRLHLAHKSTCPQLQYLMREITSLVIYHNLVLQLPNLLRANTQAVCAFG